MHMFGKYSWLLVVTLYLNHPNCVLTLGEADLEVDYTNNGVQVTLYQGGVAKLSGTLGIGIDFTDSYDLVSLSITEVDYGYTIEWESPDPGQTVTDCYDLQTGKLNWFGGPEIYQQEWPIEKLQLSGDDPYIVRKNLNFAVPERYWLSSNGVVLYIDERSPLYIDQNVQTEGQLCLLAKVTGPYYNRTRLYHKYHLLAFENPVVAHKYAATVYLGYPKELPNEIMIVNPIWTTWAKYKKYINDTVVREFAYEIEDHGFGGQIEIDEQWETCFGSRKFIEDKFSNISEVIADLKERGHTVTIWAAPFINPDCTELILEGEEKGYFVKNNIGNMTTVWWESDDARQIDFTKLEAREWYSNRLRGFTENPGVDGFKFDAGEVDYVAQPGVYETVDQELIPNILTQAYINTVSEFGSLTEVRSAYRTQNYTFYLRMIDKDSVWGLDDGLQSLVTTLLQLNMVGYSFILPDMIGGNGYRAQPSLELVIRWAEATVFMPSMQFSYLPWDFEDDPEVRGTEIVRKMIELHEKYAPKIIEAMQATIDTRTPTNPPIWWIDPTDTEALQTSDEFLLGETILVAPVMEEGAVSRTVYLPTGNWVDGNNPEIIYEGPTKFVYDAPLEVLPYFLKV